jgi:hypothetical protein
MLKIFSNPFYSQYTSYSQYSPGWEMGLLNMCIGERRKLTIPADLAYGEVGAPPDIHPGATLVFDIELMDILEPSGEDDDDLSYYERSHFTDL